MGLFDGAGKVLNGVFGALYPDALLHRKQRGPDTDGGSATAVAFAGEPGQPPATTVKATIDRLTRAMLEAEGYAEGDVGLIILTRYDGSGLPEPLPGDRLTLPAPSGTLYSLEAPITRDSADSHWTARGRPVR